MYSIGTMSCVCTACVCVCVCGCLPSPLPVWVPTPPSLLLHEPPLTVYPPSSSLILIDFGFCPGTAWRLDLRSPGRTSDGKQRVAFIKRHVPVTLLSSLAPALTAPLPPFVVFRAVDSASCTEHLSSLAVERQALGTGRPALAPGLLRPYGKNASP